MLKKANKKYKLAILTSHPIQYQAPLFKKTTSHPEINLMVYFCANIGIKNKVFDEGFGQKIKWDIPLLKGYNYKFLKTPFSIFFEIKKGQYDAIFIYGWNSLAKIICFLSAVITKTPIFLHSENPLNQELKKNKLKLFFKKVSAFLYIGKENKKFYKYYGVSGEKLFFTPYAVDNDRFQKAYREFKPKRDDLRKELGIKKEDVVILFVGKLIPKKRPLDLLNAYKLLTTDHSLLTTHLIFVGDGKLRSDLEEYVKKHKLKNVHFTGFKNQTELPEYYAIADIFVLPSGIGETWGLVVNEAMCFGLPVIVSNMPGSGYNLVEKGKNGFEFPAGDTETLAEKLRILTENKEKRIKFGNKSLEIIKNYNFKEGIKGIIKTLEYSE